MICLSLTSRARLPPRPDPDRLSPSPPHPTTTTTTTIPQPHISTTGSSSSRLQLIPLTLSLPSARMHYTYWITFPLPKKCFRLDDCLLFFHHTTTRTLSPPICHCTNLTDIPTTTRNTSAQLLFFQDYFPRQPYIPRRPLSQLSRYTHTLVPHPLLLPLNHSVNETRRKTFELYTKTHKNNNIFYTSYDIAPISLKLFFVSPRKVT